MISSKRPTGPASGGHNFFKPNSETWSRAAQDMYVGDCKVSEFIS